MADPAAYAALITDLAAEQAALDSVVAPLTLAEWDAPTPAAGWSVRDSIGHLHHFDEAAHLSATDPAGFARHRDELFAAAAEADGVDRLTLAFARAARPEDLLAAWREARAAMLERFGALAADDRLEWYGPPMSAMSFATARLMETWAHGQDVVDALGVERPATDRLRHIAHLGLRTRRFSYVVHGREAPAADVRVELQAPSGAVWEWGPPDAADSVRGTAVDFCLVVTQRRHVDDTGLAVLGPAAREWMGLAQAFAGGPGPGRPPASSSASSSDGPPVG